jgi:hypothetical protein
MGVSRGDWILGDGVGMIANMKARLLQRNEVLVDQDMWAEIVVWVVPIPVRGSEHEYKYRFALIDKEKCVLRYDNEAGKGDHKHIGEVEVPYVFWTMERLQDDFWADVERYQRGGRSWLS